ncbi:hypothetical protein AB9M62_01765 [Bacillales bacterium AN1005]
MNIYHRGLIGVGRHVHVGPIGHTGVGHIGAGTGAFHGYISPIGHFGNTFWGFNPYVHGHSHTGIVPYAPYYI